MPMWDFFMRSSFAFFVSLAALVGADAKPVKVYIMAGQSNMVGIGQVEGRSDRWGAEFSDVNVSVYEGGFDANKNYDKETPIKIEPVEQFGGTNPSELPLGGTKVVRGMLKMPSAGIYQFRPGYGESEYCVMEVEGKEAYRMLEDKKKIHVATPMKADEAVPFKITYLKDRLNVLGWTIRMDIPGTLTTVVKQQGKFPYLLDPGREWAARDDVWYRGIVSATANKWLSIGCGASPSQIGPELGFGNVMGDFHDEPVLLIKGSQGNRSLCWDFLPPGSERFEIGNQVYAGYGDSPASWEKDTKPVPVNWHAGKEYDNCIVGAKKLLENFDQEFPQYKGMGYEIAGFVWWQGHKDQGDMVYAERYEQNLAQLIKTVRKEFNVPNAPFVLATIGFGGWKMDRPEALKVANAQLAVSGETGKYPEFKGNVKTVEIRDHWRSAEESPRNQDFHYNQNAETYMLVGEALGKGMLELLGK